MRTHRSRVLAFAVALVALAALAACSSSSKSSSSSSSTSSSSSKSNSSSTSGSASAGAAADKAAFCQDNADLDAASKDVTTPDQLVQVFKANASKLDDFLKHAPDEVKADADTLVTAAKQVVADNKADALDSPAVQAAGDHVNTFCGSSSTTAGGSDSTSSSS